MHITFIGCMTWVDDPVMLFGATHFYGIKDFRKSIEMTTL